MKKIAIFFISISLFSLLVAGSDQEKYCLASKDVRGKSNEHKACFSVSEGTISEPVSKVLGSSLLLYMSLAVTSVLTVTGGIFYGLFASRFSAPGYYLLNGFIMLFVYLANRFIAMLKSSNTETIESGKVPETMYKKLMAFIYPNSDNSGIGIFDRGLRPIFEANVIILSLYMILSMISLKRHIIILVFATIFFLLDLPSMASSSENYLSGLKDKVSSSPDFFAFICITIFYISGISMSSGSEVGSENEQSSWYSPLRFLSFIFGLAHGMFISLWLLIEGAHNLETVEMNKAPNHLIAIAMWLLQPKQLLSWLNTLSPMLYLLGSDKSSAISK